MEDQIVPTSDGFGLSRIGQICVTAHDVDRAVAFYRDKLGMKHLFTVPKMAFFDCSGIMLMLGIPEGPQFDHPSSVVYFDVADIDGAYSAMLERGVRFEGKPHLIAAMDQYDLWMAFFRDSEENVLALMSRKKR
jgi:methylmalonyl-CoA/ethylmalonyl-CoA epimerase